MDRFFCCAAWVGFEAKATCRAVSSSSQCEALIGDLDVGGLSATDGVTGDGRLGLALPALLPDDAVAGWHRVVWPWIVLPVLYRIIWCLAAMILRPLHMRISKSSPRWFAFLVKYVGQASVFRSPTNPYPLIWLGVFQLVASLTTMLLFMVVTNFDATYDHIGVQILSKALGCFFVFHSFILLLKDEFVVKERWWYAVTLVDALTVPQLLTGAVCGRLSLNFLRSYRALVTYDRLEKMNSIGIIRYWSSATDMMRLTLMTLLRFLAIIVLFAGVVLVLEILGEPPGVKMTLHHTAMGEISFFTLFYWVIETISTVGYGDYAPKTTPARFATMGCMVSGVVFFAVETPKLLEIYGLEGAGTGSYKKGGREHVLLLGSCCEEIDEGVLTAFFAEIYHPGSLSQWPDAVVMVSSEASVTAMKDFVAKNVIPEAKGNVIVLSGSALKEQDLLRCCCGSATVVYIMTDTSQRSGLDPREEDKRNIMRALCVRRSFPQVPLRLLLLLSESRLQAVSAGIQSKRVVAANELKSFLLWQSTRVLGWNTLLANLMMTVGAEELDAFRKGGRSKSDPGVHPSQWRVSYAHSLKYKIAGFLANAKLIGKSFYWIVAYAYRHAGVIVVAVQHRGDVILDPSHVTDWVAHGDSVLFAVASDEKDLEPIAYTNKDWRKVFYTNRFRRFEEDDWNSPQNLLKRAGTKMTFFRGGLSSPQRRSTRQSTSDHMPSLNVPLLFDAQDVESSLSPSKRRGKTGQQNTSYNCSDQTEDNIGFTNAPIHSISGDELTVKEAHAMTIRRNADEVPFVTFIELSESWEHAAKFIHGGRLEWLPTRVSAIILCPEAPRIELLHELKLMNDPCIGIIIGSPKQLMVLISAGVQEASHIVCPAVDSPQEHGKQLTDADAVVIYQMLDAIGVIRNSMVLFEFKRIRNIRLLPGYKKQRDWFCSEESSGDDSDLENSHMLSRISTMSLRMSQGNVSSDDEEENEVTRTMNSSKVNSCHARLLRMYSKLKDNLFAEGPKTLSFQANLTCHPRFISGRVFTVDCLGSLMACGCYTPGIMEVMQALILPQVSSDVFVWEMRPRASMHDSTWAACFEELLREEDGPARGLGLYRYLTSEDQDGEEDPPRGFVFTSPPPETVLRTSDLIYVLASEAWGRRAHADRVLCDS
eukprot:TRINITY_DN5293_c0_g1_i2.p1 TRINITY_DN5293_c0_g1~~TRINITY_DN5293_c0_g1_i2.p1  ORF type:complete len:1157 (+),score=177.83 TRINITY_DN5293_c0_g1_i2:301-3771(+)